MEWLESMGGRRMRAKNIGIKRRLIVVLAAVALFFGMTGAALQFVKAEPVELNTFEMVGASVRMAPEDDEAESSNGLRFTMRISQEEQLSLGEMLEVKFRTARREFYNGELTAETENENIRDVDVTDCYFTVKDGAITYFEYKMFFYNIPVEDLYSGVRVIGVISDGENTFVTQEIERSVGYVATQALLDVRDVADDIYCYPVGNNFSRYSEEERAELEKFVVKNTLSFDSAGGTEIASQIIYKGEKAVVPEEPEKDGFIFDGWYKDGSLFDFDGELTEDTVLTAHWRLDSENFIACGNPSAITEKYAFEKVGEGENPSTCAGLGTLLKGKEGTVFRLKETINVDNKTITDSLVKFQTVGVNGEYNLTNLKVRLISAKDETNSVTVEFIERADGHTYAMAYFPGCEDIGGATSEGQTLHEFSADGVDLFSASRLSVKNNMYGGDAKRFFELSYRTVDTYAMYLLGDNYGLHSGDEPDSVFHIINDLKWNDVTNAAYTSDVWNGLSGDVYLEFEFSGVQDGKLAAVVVTEIFTKGLDQYHAIEIVVDEHGSVKLNANQKIGNKIAAGENVKIEFLADAGYVGTATVTKQDGSVVPFVEGTTDTFVMPEECVKIVASFKEASFHGDIFSGIGGVSAITDNYEFKKVGEGEYASTCSGKGTLLQGKSGTVFRLNETINVDNKTMEDSLVKFQTISVDGAYNLQGLKVKLISARDEENYVTIEFVTKSDGHTYAIAYFPGSSDIGGNMSEGQSKPGAFSADGADLYYASRLSLQNNMFGGDAKRFFELSYRTEGAYVFYLIGDNLGAWSGDGETPGYHTVNHLDFNYITGNFYSPDIWSGLSGDVYLEFEFAAVQNGGDAAVVVTEIQGKPLSA